MNSPDTQAPAPASTRPRGFGFLTRHAHHNMEANAASTATASTTSADKVEVTKGQETVGVGLGLGLGLGHSVRASQNERNNGDLLSVFQKKGGRVIGGVDSQDHSVSTECTFDMTNSVNDSPLSVQTMDGNSNATSSRSASPSSLSSSSSDVWRWHTTLLEQEETRRATVASNIQSHQARYAALRELVSNVAVVETKAACQWTIGLSKAQTQLASAFTKISLVSECLSGTGTGPGTATTAATSLRNTTASQRNTNATDDLDQRYLAVARRVTDESSLPEKPIRIGFDVDDVDSEHTTKGGDGSEMGHDDEWANANGAQPSSQPSNVAGPPVTVIAFPNPKVPHETLAMLHKQHVLLSETLVRQTISAAALDKVQLLKDLCHENSTTLEQVAGAILVDLQAKETNIQKLWNVYHTAAEGMLTATSNANSGSESSPQGSSSMDTSTRTTPKKQKAFANNSASLSEVWLAELAYRQAVAHQASTWDTQLQTLQSMFEVAKEGECQRRAKLRRHLLVSVIAKHTAAFHHAQQLHADALEDCMRYYNGEDRKGKVKATPQRDWSIRERIDHMAHQSGSTVVWDDAGCEDLTKNTITNSHQTSGSPKKDNQLSDESIVENGNLIDVDDFMEFSSDEDDDDLPLLAQAEDLKEKQQQTKEKAEAASALKEKPKSKESSSKGRSKSKDSKKRKTKRKVETPNKANRIIMLDHDSPHESFFMDRLLYSGSLLESHYVQFAAVAKVEDERPSTAPYVNEGNNDELTSEELQQPRDEAPVAKTSLVVVTEDDILHLFDIDSAVSGAVDIDASPTFGSNAPKGIVPGSSPAAALQFFLKRLETADLSLKKQQHQQRQEASVEKEGPVTPSKMSFLRSATSGTSGTREKEKTKTFEFKNINTSFSIPVSGCSFRFFKRGEFAVKVGPKNLQAMPYYGKISFASAKDQQAFVEASVPKG